MPPLLSATGVFADVRTLTPAPGLIPYELVVPFWSDGAQKQRLMALPAGKIRFSADGEWAFPPGTVFVKTFSMPTDEAHPQQVRRLETRLLVVREGGGVYGVVYRWREDGSDADLLPAAATQTVSRRDASGKIHAQQWYFPSREDCLTCHTRNAGNVLGVKTRQLNRTTANPGGAQQNQLRAWNRMGLFSPAIEERQFASLPRLAAPDDATRSVQERARSWLDANCSQCHRPGGTVAGFDARFDTPPDAQNIVGGRVLIDQGVDRARVIAPHDPWRSIALLRVDTNGDLRMPPLARMTIDHDGVALLKAWISSLPGPDVVPPPRISVAGDRARLPVAVMLTAQPGDDIRYTLDGSAPGPMDQRYEAPIQVSTPTTVRARAYRQGATRSIIVQETYAGTDSAAPH